MKDLCVEGARRTDSNRIFNAEMNCSTIPEASHLANFSKTASPSWKIITKGEKQL